MRIYLYASAACINIIFWLFLQFLFLFNKSYEVFYLYLTLLNFSLSTFYLSMKAYFEFKLHLNKTDAQIVDQIKNSKVFKFTSNILSKFAFTLCIGVCVCFWALCLGGEKLMIFETEHFFKIFSSIYLHFIIGIMIFVEIYHSEIDLKEDYFFRDLVILVIFEVIYAILLDFLAKTYDKYAIYPFLKLETNLVIFLNLIIALISFNVYQLFYYLHSKKQNRRTSSNVTSSDLDEKMIV